VKNPFFPSKLGRSRIRERTGVSIMASWERSKGKEEGNETQNHCVVPLCQGKTLRLQLPGEKVKYIKKDGNQMTGCLSLIIRKAENSARCLRVEKLKTVGKSLNSAYCVKYTVEGYILYLDTRFCR